MDAIQIAHPYFMDYYFVNHLSRYLCVNKFMENICANDTKQKFYRLLDNVKTMSKNTKYTIKFTLKLFINLLYEW